MQRLKALDIASSVTSCLQPHCERIALAGSLRRGAKEVKDIDIVCIPKPYQIGLFESGFASVVNQWPKLKGELPCKYTQRKLPEGITLELYMASAENFGLIHAIRTGSANFTYERLAKRWKKYGFYSKDGMLMYRNTAITIPTEKRLFDILQMKYVQPQMRNL